MSGEIVIGILEKTGLSRGSGRSLINFAVARFTRISVKVKVIAVFYQMKASQYNKNLPHFLHRTKKQLDEQKVDLRESVDYDENIARFNRAVNEETLATEALAMNPQADEGFLTHQYTRLAESFLERGMFKEAAKIQPDERTKDFYKRITAASKKSKDCDCTESRTINEQREGNIRNQVEVSKYRLWRVVFDGSPKKLISIFVCNHCRNVKVEYEAE